MDDNKFDDKIRNKVNDYQYTDFDQSAFADFQSRMDNVKIVRWYEPYLKPLKYAAAIIFISLLNFGLYAYYDAKNNDLLMTQLAELRADNEELDALKNQLSEIQRHRNTPDTVYVKSSFTKIGRYASNYENYEKGGSSNQEAILKFINQLPVSYQQLINEYASTNSDFSNLYQYNKNELYSPSKIQGKGFEPYKIALNSRFEIAPVDMPAKNALDKEDKKYSVAFLRNVEKHHMHGIGVKVGPELEIGKLGGADMSGRAYLGLGAEAEIIFTPAVRLVTGVNYITSNYVLNSAHDLKAEAQNYPAIDNEIGELNKIESRTHAIVTPIHAKYNYPLDRNRDIFVSAGLSPYVATVQNFNYSYGFNYDGAGNQDDYSVDIKAKKHTDSPKFYAGTVDMKVGMERKVNDNSTVSFAAFYKRSVEPIGIEGENYGVAGIQTAIKFTAR